MKVRSKIFYWYAALVIVFTALSLLPAPDHATLVKYHISALTLHLISLTLIIPEVLIWFTAFYGYSKLQNYSQIIKESAEGRQIAKLATGLFLLAVGLPVAAIFSTVLSVIALHFPAFKPASVVIRNYGSIVFPLLAFIWISAGAHGLGNLNKARLSLRLLNAVVLAVLILGIVFCCLIVLDHRELRTTYHMSPQLVMLTLGIPYMYIWFLGLFSVAELREYSRKVRGIVYRKSWKLFIVGIAAIILLSILLQYLSALSSWLTSLSLGWVLLLLYVLLLLLAVGYIVLALGAQSLTKIEEA